MSRSSLLSAVCLLAMSLAAIAADPSKPATEKKPEQPEKKWTSLFDGKTLKGWEVTKFGGEGEVLVKDGAIVLEFGADLTGIHTKRKLPKINYEVELEAQRFDGSDFFCGFTFPVKDDPCSLILGGWGGSVCGLSSIDRLDASENETTTYQTFKNKQWYHVRLRVTEKRISAWLDKKQIVKQDIDGRKISVRGEVDASRPFGFAAWQTTAALRKIRIRELTKEELAGTKKKIATQ